ncbi:isochorismatase family protein [Alteromonas facilis]|uniref:isochorismatase family protein n=1 Tax=Alteromonas facilis TaxID=2048004 RepID=UPI000C28A7EF|nr:isochorismatase family protein [Alteromonas facilis]
MNCPIPQHTQLLVVDIQEKLYPHIEQCEHVLMRAKQLMLGASAFQLPITIVEQYPEGLGQTHTELLESNILFTKLTKATFSALKTTTIKNHLQSINRKNLIICGTESHVCVLQTALDAMNQGFNVWLAWDACGSRFNQDKALAFTRLQDSGCAMVTTEMLLFEWMETKEHILFPDIIQTLKA